jgi:hypothetical protein
MSSPYRFRVADASRSFDRFENDVLVDTLLVRHGISDQQDFLVHRTLFHR